VDRGSITEDLGHALHDLGRVVANADNPLSAQFLGVLDHEFVRVGTGALAESRIDRDVPAEEELDGRAEVSDNAPGPDDDAANNSQALRNAIAGQVEGRGDEVMVQRRLPCSVRTAQVLTGSRIDTNSHARIEVLRHLDNVPG
jgi:hypothetical protein